MSSKVLRDRDGKELGRILPSGQELVLRDHTGREVARYHTKLDVTRDAKGAIVGRGNLLGYLLGLSS